MLELTITVWDNEAVEVPFSLKTLPLLTPANTAAPLVGSWFCTSPYLGNTSTGNYYIKKVADPECTVEQRWISGCRGSMGQMGFFFDSRDTPFLLLDSFYPTMAGAKDLKKEGTLRLGSVRWAAEQVRWVPK